MNLKTTIKTVLALLSGSGLLLAQEGTADFQTFREIRRLQADAQAKIVQQDHEDAAEIYQKIARLETSKAKQAAALVQAADQFMKAEQGNDALENYTSVLQNYSLYSPHDHVVQQLRKLAEDFIVGKGTFLSLRDVNGAIKIYELIIREAPASHVSNKDRFRLAELLRQEDRPEEAVAIYQTIAKKEIRNWDARAQMAIVLAQLAKISDGDGTKTRAAVREAKLVLAYKPDHPRAKELEKLIADAYELSAERLLEQAEFYLIKAHLRPAAARRYLHDVILKYPDSQAARKADQYLKTVPELVTLERNPQATPAEQARNAQQAQEGTPQAKPTFEKPVVPAGNGKPAFEKPAPVRRDGKPAFEKPGPAGKAKTPDKANPDKANPDKVTPDKANPDKANPDKVNPDKADEKDAKDAPQKSEKPAFDRPTTVRRDGKPAFDRPTTVRRDGKPAFDRPAPVRRDGKPAFDRPTTVKRDGKPAFDRPSTSKSDKPAFDRPSEYFKLVHNIKDKASGSSQKPAFDKPSKFFLDQQKAKEAKAKRPPEPKPALPALPAPRESAGPAFSARPLPRTSARPVLQPKRTVRTSQRPLFAPSMLNRPTTSSGFEPAPINRPATKTPQK